jgi:hypothetical protein
MDLGAEWRLLGVRLVWTLCFVVWTFCFVVVVGSVALVTSLVTLVFGMLGLAEAFSPVSCNDREVMFCYDDSTSAEWEMRVIGLVLLFIAGLLSWLSIFLWRATVHGIRKYATRRRSYVGSSG